MEWLGSVLFILLFRISKGRHDRFIYSQINNIRELNHEESYSKDSFSNSVQLICHELIHLNRDMFNANALNRNW